MRSSVNISATIVLAAVLANAAHAAIWQSPANWHRLLKKDVPGSVVLDDVGVEFRSPKFNQHWAYIDVHSVDVSTRELTIISYENRPWHQPGERRYQFTLGDPMPPDIAAQLAERVGKPVRNGIPLPSAAVLTEIPAHRRMWSGGSNGMLRLKDTGIDYITEGGRNSRTWRWADIQTIANPNPYELRVTGYRETAEFDLKQPLARAVFEQMWDRLYAAGLNLSVRQGEAHR